MDRNCFVVCSRVENLAALEDPSAVLACVKTLVIDQYDIRWHDVILKKAEDLALPHEDFDENDRTFPWIIACCSVPVSQSANIDEESIVSMMSSCVYGSQKIFGKCEIWLTAPCLVPLFSESIHDLCIDGEVCSSVSVMNENGMAVIRNAVDCEQTAFLRTICENWISQAELAVSNKRPDIILGEHLFAFSEFSSRGRQRFDLLFPESNPKTAPIFQLAQHGRWVPIIRTLLGENFQVMASVVYSRPGADEQDWHTDGAHLGRTNSWDLVCNCSAPYAICVFLALIDLDRTVGYTQFWPQTHQQAGLAGFGPAAPLLGSAVDGLMSAGSCVLYDYRLMHRGMGNTSVSTQRPLIQFLYHIPSYVERKNYGCESLFG